MNFESVEDFLEDDRFRKWVLHHRKEDDAYWKEWAEAHPEKKELLYQAIAAWQLISEAPAGWSESIVRERQAALLRKLEQQSRPPSFLSKYRYYAAAAILLIISVIGIEFSTPDGGIFFRTPDRGLEPSADKWMEYSNTTTVPLLINLPDGSSVLLSPASELQYARQFTGSDRSVYLKGEAFFEVVKNVGSPFYVRTSRLTTKVLGTSFRVRSFEAEETASVKVTTGEVEVSPVIEEHAIDQQSEISSMIMLSKHEEAILQQQPGTPDRTIISEVRAVNAQLIDEEMYRFRFTPVSEVFGLLQEVYNVRISYDADKFSGCSLTASLEDMPFLKKLELICESIDAVYFVEGNDIKISGAGCR